MEPIYDFIRRNRFVSALYLGVIVIGLNCAVTKWPIREGAVAGSYSLERNGDSFELLLRPNHTYSYRYGGQERPFSLQGSWSYSKKFSSLHLDSFSFLPSEERAGAGPLMIRCFPTICLVKSIDQGIYLRRRGPATDWEKSP